MSRFALPASFPLCLFLREFAASKRMFCVSFPRAWLIASRTQPQHPLHPRFTAAPSATHTTPLAPYTRVPAPIHTRTPSFARAGVWRRYPRHHCCAHAVVRRCSRGRCCQARLRTYVSGYVVVCWWRERVCGEPALWLPDCLLLEWMIHGRFERWERKEGRC